MKGRQRLTAVVLAAHLACTPAWAGDVSAEAAAVDRLRADLLGGWSATVVLTRWCGDLALARPPIVRAERVRGADKPADAGVRALLRAGPDEPIGYRRVRLTCGGKLLSEADNWYLPGALTAEMNRRLDETDTPFGAVVAPLAFHRQTLGATPLAGPEAALRVRALLINGAGRPFSLVVETYAKTLVAFGSPSR